MAGRQISSAPTRARPLCYQGEPTILAETFEGKRLNAPNAAIVHQKGRHSLTVLLRQSLYYKHVASSSCRRACTTSTPNEAATSSHEIKDPNALLPPTSHPYVADTARPYPR